MIKTVLDTNVLLVSISDRSPFHWIFQDLIKGRFELCVTTEILLEYEEIIERHMGRTSSQYTLATILHINNVKRVDTYYKFGLMQKDPDDNKFVDCAIAANADFIVTEDKDFTELKNIKFPKVNFIDINQFKAILDT